MKTTGVFIFTLVTLTLVAANPIPSPLEVHLKFNETKIRHHIIQPALNTDCQNLTNTDTRMYMLHEIRGTIGCIEVFHKLDCGQYGKVIQNKDVTVPFAIMSYRGCRTNSNSRG